MKHYYSKNNEKFCYLLNENLYIEIPLTISLSLMLFSFEIFVATFLKGSHFTFSFSKKNESKNYKNILKPDNYSNAIIENKFII